MIVAGIPAYNEEKTIARVVLLAQKHVDVVVVCDDGSQDMTADIAQRLGAVVIKHERNMGYGAAIREIFNKARTLNADLLLTLDADGQHDANDVPRLIQSILDNNADVVIGSRFLQQNSHMPLYRRFGVKVLTKMTNGAGREGAISDGQCGFRAYNRKAIDGLALAEDGMGVSAEVLMKARALGLVVTEVPIEVRYQGLETSTHHPLKHGLGVVSTITRMVVEERPLYYLGLPGWVLLCIGIFFGLWTVDSYTKPPYRIITNIALTSVFFTLLGVFFIFTSVTLYGILQAVKRERSR